MNWGRAREKWGQLTDSGFQLCKSLLVFLTAAATLPVATISTSAFCDPTNGALVGPIVSNGGGLGSSHADCGGQVLDRGNLWGNGASADAWNGGVSASYSVYRFAPLRVNAEAIYENDFAVTIFGGSGFGLFTPCFSVTGGGGAAHATATLREPTVIITSLGGPGQSSIRFSGGNNCINNPVLNPGNGFSFAFGAPVSFGIALDALVYDVNPFGTSEADFLFSFNVTQVVPDSSGHHPSFQPLPNATWNLMDLSVPEPSTAGLLAFTMAGLFFALRFRRI